MKVNLNLSNSILIIIVCTFLTLSCSNDNKTIIQKDSVVKLMTELMTIESLNEPDSVKAIKIIKIITDNEIEIDSLKKVISKFETNPEYWQSVYSKIKNQLKKPANRNPTKK